MAKRSAKKAVKKAKGTAGKATKGSPPASPLQAFFEQSGVQFRISGPRILSSLRDQMGPERFQRWQAVSSDRHMGIENSENEYASFANAAELNTVFSLQADCSLAACTWLTDRVKRHEGDKATIGDLGCGAGVLTGWLAKSFPSSRVYGFDALPNVVEAAASSQASAHLSFHKWDYAADAYPLSERCDVLVSCFGLDFPTGLRDVARHSLDAPSLRGLPYYQAMNDWLRPVFRHWRSAVHDNAAAYLVLRIPDDVLFMAAVDAAHQEGWTFSSSQFVKLQCGDERFPSLTLKATTSALLSEQEITQTWARMDLQAAFPSILKDTAAIAVFRALSDKQIAKSETRTYDDGHTMRAMVGTAGSVGFRFSHATTGFARLKLMSADDALASSPGFPEDGELLDISDLF